MESITNTQTHHSKKSIMINEDHNNIVNDINNDDMNADNYDTNVETNSQRVELRSVSRLHLAHFLDLIYVAGILYINTTQT